MSAGRDPPSQRAVKLGTREPLLQGVAALLRHDTAKARQRFEQGLALALDDPAAENLLKSCASAR